MDQNCERCRDLAAAGRALATKAVALESATDRNSPRYLDTKGTIGARLHELHQGIADHEADAHYLDLLVMCSDTLALMPLPQPPH